MIGGHMNIHTSIDELADFMTVLELIHDAYAHLCIKAGLLPAPLYFETVLGRQVNLFFIEALNKYMLVKGFNEGIKPLIEVIQIHHKIKNT
jgi:hypothetical protein